MQKLPYPPAPELGWYADDEAAGQILGAIDDFHPGHSQARAAAPEPLQTADARAAELDDDSFIPQGADLEYTAAADAQGSEEWDGTVLSTAFMKQPHANYRMTNEITGQTILVDMGVLMGRRPSQDIPAGAKSVRLIDPTRTVSRNHAAISFDEDGSMWLEDFGSLNGTAIYAGDTETPVLKGAPVQLHAPARIRIGDQIFDFEQA
ncbi:FHA domain-containing protein [Bifidobacterium pseudolongum]|uniref:FHA domain-containing protein n=1 Tax=Bifidobacterium pseudolongum TaxID=1694 RepID=UPI0010210DBE|nr:FHA domain-containing protein [Bifidobacterium pseudolongum]RYQ29082.1 FHA domain-containing protein [Bifidobacterium pseudolongum subsp. globosum]